MSRTKRHIPDYYRNYNKRIYTPSELTSIGLGYSYDFDPRHDLGHGYDTRKRKSSVNSGTIGIGNKARGWGDFYTGKTRKHYKRLKAKRVRVRGVKEFLQYEE